MTSASAAAAPDLRLVVFDMDGLLIDSERPIRDAWIEVSAEAGRPLTAQERRNAGDLRARVDALPPPVDGRLQRPGLVQPAVGAHDIAPSEGLHERRGGTVERRQRFDPLPRHRPQRAPRQKRRDQQRPEGETAEAARQPALDEWLRAFSG